MFEGLILGLISWLSLLLSWWHLPKPAKEFTKKHPVITDISSGLFIYFTLSSVSKSLIAVVGAITAGLLVNFTIMIHNFLNGKHK